MQYSICYRKKNGGWQYLISYKTRGIDRWRQKAKQGFRLKRDAKRAAIEALEDLKDNLSKNKILNGNYRDITLKELYDVHVRNIAYTSSESTRKSFYYAVESFKSLHNKKIVY